MLRIHFMLVNKMQCEICENSPSFSMDVDAASSTVPRTSDASVRNLEVIDLTVGFSGADDTDSIFNTST
jgi:hypothetical protein